MSEIPAGKGRFFISPKLWASVAAVALVGWWATSPSYLEIDLPVVPGRFGYFWYTTTYAVETYADTPGALYVRRQYRSGLPSQFKTKEEALAWFATQLRERGWVPASKDHVRPRAPVPELDFLKADEHFTYYQPDDFSGFERVQQGERAQVTTAVWTDHNGGTNILFVTTKASFLRYLSRDLDD